VFGVHVGRARFFLSFFISRLRVCVLVVLVRSKEHQIDMDPGKSKRRVHQCSPRRKRTRANGSDRKLQKRDPLNSPFVSDWRSSCLGYTRRYL
jgi:hypothetical protein